MDALRPRTVAELGTHLGYSLFVMAEAAKRLTMDTCIVGIDSWEGDEHAGFYGQEVFDSVKDVADRDYAALVELRRGFFSTIAPTFAAGSVDLLHIDGRHGYDDVAKDFAIFAPKLSDRGVVLLHDTFEFQPGFGVNRFWSEVSSRYPSFNFEHGHGLGVLAVGTGVPPRVLEFLSRASSDPAGARDAYARLGAELSATVALRSLAEERMEVIERLSRLAQERMEVIDRTTRVAEEQHRNIMQITEENRQFAAEVHRLEGVVHELRSSTSWRMTSPVRAASSAIGRFRSR